MKQICCEKLIKLEKREVRLTATETNEWLASGLEKIASNFLHKIAKFVIADRLPPDGAARTIVHARRALNTKFLRMFY